MLSCPLDDLGMGPKPYAFVGFGVADDLFEDPNPRTVADDVRMHRQLEDAAFLVGRIELASENIEYVAWRSIGP